MSQHKTNIANLLREIVAYCREAGHEWSNLAEAEAALAAAQAQQAGEVATLKYLPAGAELYVHGVRIPYFEIGTSGDKRREDVRDAINAAACATPPAPAQPVQGVPEGWRLVPVEPTPEMKSAGITIEIYSEVSDSIGALTWAEVAAIYRAMLTASPTPPAQQGEKS